MSRFRIYSNPKWKHAAVVAFAGKFRVVDRYAFLPFGPMARKAIFGAGTKIETSGLTLKKALEVGELMETALTKQEAGIRRRK